MENPQYKCFHQSLKISSLVSYEKFQKNQHKSLMVVWLQSHNRWLSTLKSRTIALKEIIFNKSDISLLN